MIQIDTSLALIGCFILCAAYAAILSTKRGRTFTVSHTWVTVVVGVLIVLGCLALTNLNDALMTFAFFVAGGAPMILRSLWLEYLYQRELIDHQREELDHERNHKGDD